MSQPSFETCLFFAKSLLYMCMRDWWQFFLDHIIVAGAHYLQCTLSSLPYSPSLILACPHSSSPILIFRGGGGDSAGGIFHGESSVFQFGAEFPPYFSRGGAEFSPCGIVPVSATEGPVGVFFLA